MQKLLLSLLVVVLCAPMLLARRDGSERRSQKQAARGCEYKFSDCVFEGGATCGNGKKTGTSDQPDCQVKSIEKKCRVKCSKNQQASAGSANAAAQPSNCKYKPARGQDRAECDPVTKKKAVTQTLVSGDAACQKTMITYKPCRSRNPREVGYQNDGPADDSRCKYRKGQKGECNQQTNMRTITLNLKKKSPPTCAPTKTIEKACRVKPSRPEKVAKKNKQNNRRVGQN